MAQADMKNADGTGPKLETMTIAVSASTLFIMNDQQASKTNGEKILKQGVAFPFVKALVKANDYFQKLYPDNEKPFKIFLMNNTATQEKCLKDSLKEFGLSEISIHEDDISNLTGNILYLTEDPEKAEIAIKNKHAAGIMFPNDPNMEVQSKDEEELRVAFDGDGILFSDESEKVTKGVGLEAFFKNEKDKQDIPLEKGPLKCFLEVLCNLREKLSDKSPFKVLTYLVTARGSGIPGFRALMTLKTWGLELNQGFFLCGSPKGPSLQMIRPHIFFDDQQRHIDAARKLGIISAHVPYGIGYETPAKKPKK
ncbi:cytosolic 5'-nucleotidase 1A-like [Anguilla rostrata]|uniref:cytosolic 5'-nucleotidase 1A-like n=1 Tax=Anguilla rostrata TaxID=7938 RepID=UPI0030D14710